LFEYLAINVEDHVLVFFQHEHIHGLIKGGYFLVRSLEGADGIDAAQVRQAGNLAFPIRRTLQGWAT
jgi:hypothetical protein